MTRFPVSPEYRYRFSRDEIAAAYANLEEAFDAGDYCFVAECADSVSELFGCAMTLLGFPHVGLPVLERATPLTRRGRCCRVLALWSLDRNQEALAAADGLVAAFPGDAAAEQLRRLVAAERINVLQIATVTLMHAELGASATARSVTCGPFTIEQMGIPSLHDTAYRCDRRFDAWLDERPAAERPDFILAATPQCFLPRGIADVDIPKIAYQHDIDVFADRNWDNYSQFDLSLVCTSFEHFELSRATGVRCASVFQNDPIGQPFVIGERPAAGRKKSIDVLLSGSVLDYSHPEKARFALRLSRLADERIIRIVEGYVPAARYAGLLAAAKFLPVVSRLRGNPSPRWRDALCNGAYCLYPTDTLFGRLSRGLFAYDETDIEGSVRRHLERYDRSSPGDPYCHDMAWRDVEAYYRFFAVPRTKRLEVALKAITVMHVLSPRPAPARTPARTVWLMPFWEGAAFNPSAVATRALRMARATESDGLRDDVDVATLAALYAALAMLVEWKLSETPELRIDEEAAPPGVLFEAFVAKAHALLDEGVRRFPDSLLLHFNAVHTRLMFALPLYRQPAGRPSHRLTGADRERGHQPGGDRDAALACRDALDRLIADEPSLRFDPRGGFGFAPAIHRDHLLPYMRLSGGLLAELARQPATGDPGCLRPLVRAALLGYRGRLAAEAGESAAALEWYERGLALDPDNLGLLEQVVELGVASFERGALSDSRLADLADRAAALIERYPVFLFRWPGRIVEMLLRLGRDGEAAAYLDDWYRFGRTVEAADGTAQSLNAAKFRALLHHGHLLPERLRCNLAAWRQQWDAGTFVEPEAQFDRFLLAAVIAEDWGIERALHGLCAAAVRLAADDPDAAAVARSARLALAEIFVRLPAGIAFAAALMSQSVWDAEWFARERQPRPLGRWRAEDVAALRQLAPDARDDVVLAAVDRGFSEDFSQHQALRWLLVAYLYRDGRGLRPLPVLPRALPGSVLAFAAIWLDVKEDQIPRA